MIEKFSIYGTEGVLLLLRFRIGWAGLAALVLMGTINFGLAEGKYSSILAVCFYTSCPSIIKRVGIVVIYAGVAPESFNIKNFAPTNLGAFLNPLETNAALTRLRLLWMGFKYGA